MCSSDLASLTKLLTLYAASETLSPSFPVAISEAAIRQEGDSGFSAGETFGKFSITIEAE